jgi:hypothetical protein
MVVETAEFFEAFENLVDGINDAFHALSPPRKRQWENQTSLHSRVQISNTVSIRNTLLLLRALFTKSIDQR